MDKQEEILKELKEFKEQENNRWQLSPFVFLLLMIFTIGWWTIPAIMLILWPLSLIGIVFLIIKILKVINEISKVLLFNEILKVIGWIFKMIEKIFYLLPFLIIIFFGLGILICFIWLGWLYFFI